MLVIFDCDGVLIDSEVIYCAVDAEVLTRMGHPTTPADIARRFTGVKHRDMWEILSAELGFVRHRQAVDEAGLASAVGAEDQGDGLQRNALGIGVRLEVSDAQGVQQTR